MKEFDFVRKDVPRVDAVDKATGNAQFTVDLALPNMLFGKLLRSPHPHARILNIDTRKAERLPGVKGVITGKETPYVFGVSHFDQTPLQTEKVRHVGDAVAAVAAVDLDTAEEALRLIRVDYEPLPAVFDPIEAMKPGAPSFTMARSGISPLTPFTTLEVWMRLSPNPPMSLRIVS